MLLQKDAANRSYAAEHLEEFPGELQASELAGQLARSFSFCQVFPKEDHQGWNLLLITRLLNIGGSRLRLQCPDLSSVI